MCDGTGGDLKINHLSSRKADPLILGPPPVRKIQANAAQADVLLSFIRRKNMTKKILLGVPPRLLEQVDLLAQYRSQTRSELIREALRAHLEKAGCGGPLPALQLVPFVAKN